MNLKFKYFKLIMISWLMMNFLNSNSFNMNMMMMLSDYFLMILMSFMFMMMYLYIYLILKKLFSKFIFYNNKLEINWTLIPMLLIFLMSLYSIKILFLNYENNLNFMMIKIISNQWFWFYEYLNLNKKFNSYLMYKNNFNFFNLEVNNKLIIPMNFQIQIIISSMDVIHSWSIPSLNIKIDSIPNQINNFIFLINKINIIFGQCSEVCGIYHSFMPIQIESINFKNFLNWI